MQMLTENWRLKIFSVFVATLLWLFFGRETEFSTSLPAELEYRNVPQDLELSVEPLDQIFLKVRGPAARLNSNALGTTALVLDLRSAHSPGDQTFAINQKTLELPAGITLLHAVPSQVRVRLEKRVFREVPIEALFTGNPAPGYLITSQQIKPARLRVVGPESQMEQIRYLRTDPINLSEKLGTTEFRVPVYIPNPHVRCECDNASVVVRVTLSKRNRGL